MNSDGDIDSAELDKPTLHKPFVNIKVCQTIIKIRVDTGAETNIIDESTFYSLNRRPLLKKCTFNLHVYGKKSPVKTLGEFNCTCKFKDIKSNEKFIITKGNYGNLLSYDTSVNLGKYL